MKFPSFKDMPDFNPESPFDARAEEIRRRVVDAFADGNFVITADNAEATMAGMTVALLGILMACTDENGHRDLVDAFERYLPWAAAQCREMLGLDALRDN